VGWKPGLRIAGYGYPTSFFLESYQNGERVLIENPKFGWRFFPSFGGTCALNPWCCTRPNLRVLFAFSSLESPRPWATRNRLWPGRQLERILRARHPGTGIEVVNVAMTAINSHVIGKSLAIAGIMMGISG
jgi:hypothetical protein